MSGHVQEDTDGADAGIDHLAHGQNGKRGIPRRELGAKDPQDQLTEHETEQGDRQREKKGAAGARGTLTAMSGTAINKATMLATLNTPVASGPLISPSNMMPLPALRTCIPLVKQNVRALRVQGPDAKAGAARFVSAGSALLDCRAATSSATTVATP
jgi:hypothetical protein